MAKRPGGELAARPLHFIWIVDCSGSMAADGKIESLNNAVAEAMPHMRQTADDNPNAQVLVRVLRFSNGAQWHVSQPTRVEDFQWTPLTADGVTDLGKALGELADAMSVEKMPSRALPPVLVLISDGQPTDDYKVGLRKLLDQPWGKKAVRIAISIGRDADQACLQEFIGHPEIKPLQANNPERLVELIKWSSTAVVQSASAPASQSTDDLPPGMNVPVPEAPAESDGQDGAADVW